MLPALLNGGLEVLSSPLKPRCAHTRANGMRNTGVMFSTDNSTSMYHCRELKCPVRTGYFFPLIQQKNHFSTSLLCKVSLKVVLSRKNSLRRDIHIHQEENCILSQHKERGLFHRPLKMQNGSVPLRFLSVSST